MHSGVSAEMVHHRLIELSEFPGELLVTEFDVDEPNPIQKAEDVEDFRA